MRDLMITERRCYYCGRAGVHEWESGRWTCAEAICHGLAYGREVGFKAAPVTNRPPTPEQELRWSLAQARRRLERAEQADRAYDERFRRAA
jgi:hypothetical protein